MLLSQSYLFFFCVSIFRAYDRAALKFRGVEADINFTVSDYEEDMKQVGLDDLLFFIF